MVRAGSGHAGVCGELDPGFMLIDRPRPRRCRGLLPTALPSAKPPATAGAHRAPWARQGEKHEEGKPSYRACTCDASDFGAPRNFRPAVHYACNESGGSTRAGSDSTRVLAKGAEWCGRGPNILRLAGSLMPFWTLAESRGLTMSWLSLIHISEPTRP